MIAKKALARIKRLAEQAPCYGHVNSFVYIDRDGVITANSDVDPGQQHAVARAINTRGKSFLEGRSPFSSASGIKRLAAFENHPRPCR